MHLYHVGFSDWNSRIEISCQEGEGGFFLQGTFLAENFNSEVDFDAYIRFNCSNETHYEVCMHCCKCVCASCWLSFKLTLMQVSSTFTIYKVGNNAMRMIPQQLSGNVKCTTFGCYEAVYQDLNIDTVKYNFSPTLPEENCSPPVNVTFSLPERSQKAVPTNTFTLSSSPTLTSIISSSSHMLEIYTTITENHLSYATVLSTSLSTTNFVSSAAPTTSFGSSAASTTNFVSSAAPTTSFGSSVASTPPNNMPQSHSLHIMGLLLLAPFFLLSFSLLMCISITVKRWRKNK